MTKFVDKSTYRPANGGQPVLISEVIRINLAWYKTVSGDLNASDEYLVEVLSTIVSVLDQLALLGPAELHTIGGFMTVEEDPNVA